AWGTSAERTRCSSVRCSHGRQIREDKTQHRGPPPPDSSRLTRSMSVSLRDAPPSPRLRRPRRRAAWRQWLVAAERGLTAGFRSDSVFFVHLFGGSLAIAAAAMLGLTATQWAILILALSVTIASELFHQVLKQISDLSALAGVDSAASLRRLGTAAVAVSTLG